MKEIENIPHKLPSQEIDYFKIGKILLSRWYWIAGAVVAGMLAANVYLWYTPKTYATSGTMKFEEKKSEISEIAGTISASDKGPSKVQTETMVLQSRNVVINAIKDLDYRISFYVVGRVLNRTNELYPQKPLDIQLLKFDTANFFHDIVSFKPVNNSSFSLSYAESGRQVEKTINYNAPFTLGNMALRIKTPVGLLKNVVYQFKFNAPEDFLDRVRGGLRTSEVIRNSNIVSLQQVDPNPQFAADALNAVMTEYLNYDRSQRMQSATQMINFIDTQLKYLSDQVKGSEKSIEKYKQNLKIMDVGSAAEAALSKAKDLESQLSLLKIQLIALEQLKADIIKEKNNVTLNFNAQNDSRITFYKQPKRLSMYNNFSFLLEKASGNYFMWAADDDWWSPDFIEKIMELLCRNPAAVAGFSNFMEVDENNNKILSYPDHLPLLQEFTISNNVKRVKNYINQFEGFGKANLFYSVFKTNTLKSKVVFRLLEEGDLPCDMLINLSVLLEGSIVVVDQLLRTNTCTLVKGYSEEIYEPRWINIYIAYVNVGGLTYMNKKWRNYLHGHFNIIRQSNLSPVKKLLIYSTVIKKIVLFNYDLICCNVHLRGFNIFSKIRRQNILG